MCTSLAHPSGIETINGINIYYEYYPNHSTEQTIVLIHGFLSSSFSFRLLVPLLATEFNVISVDLPPFGKSGKIDNYTYSYENNAQTILYFINKKKLENVSLIGHSMGGQIALNIALKQPEMVNRIVLLASSGYMKRVRKSLIWLSYLPFFHLIVKMYLANSGLRKNLENVIYDHTLIDEEMLAGYEAPFRENRIFRALARMIRDREGDLSSDDLGKILTPCLLIWGEEDKVVPVKVGERLHRELYQSRFIILKRTGHLLPEECPETVYKYISAFFQEKLT